MPPFPLLPVYLAQYGRHLVFYVLVAGAFYWLYWRGRRSAPRIQPTPRRGSLSLRAEVGNSLRSFLIFALVDVVVLWAYVTGHTQLYDSVAAYGWFYFGFSLLLMVLCQDTYFYWIHRLLHLPYFFRRVHHVHHRSTDPSAWASYSFHPIEALLQPIGGVLPVFLFPVSIYAALLFQAVMVLMNVVGHMGYEIYPAGATQHWLLRWKTTATHHNLHHARSRGNYGFYFTWWDKWFGTETTGYEAYFENLFTKPEKTKTSV